MAHFTERLCSILLTSGVILIMALMPALTIYFLTNYPSILATIGSYLTAINGLFATGASYLSGSNGFYFHLTILSFFIAFIMKVFSKTDDMCGLNDFFFFGMTFSTLLPYISTYTLMLLGQTFKSSILIVLPWLIMISLGLYVKEKSLSYVFGIAMIPYAISSLFAIIANQ